jgi:phosphoglycerate kinase
MTTFKTLNKLNFRGKTVLLRADLNVPLKDGIVTDNTRCVRLLPTLKELAQGGAKIVILSHFGRPEGKPNAKFSLRPVAKELEKIWGQKIQFAEDCVGPIAKAAVAVLPAGHILVLENTRFHPEEETNDFTFASELASLGDLYVNDAFSAAHRAHASTEALAHLLPSAAGRLMQSELEALENALHKPERPVTAIIGGSKISTKIDVLKNLASKVNSLVLGGAMANTFLAADGYDVGRSLYETNMLETAREIVREAKTQGCQLILPIDAVTASLLKAHIARQTVTINAIAPNDMILDIGPQSEKLIVDILQKSKTVLWNGPLGAFEYPPFDHATTTIAHAIGRLTKERKILSVAGGGDTVSALNNANVMDELSYVSTAGGAFLEWIEGKELPGVTALLN